MGRQWSSPPAVEWVGPQKHQKAFEGPAGRGRHAPCRKKAERTRHAARPCSPPARSAHLAPHRPIRSIPRPRSPSTAALPHYNTRAGATPHHHHRTPLSHKPASPRIPSISTTVCNQHPHAILNSFFLLSLLARQLVCLLLHPSPLPKTISCLPFFWIIHHRDGIRHVKRS
jgi:hypothetical protein